MVDKILFICDDRLEYFLHTLEPKSFEVLPEQRWELLMDKTGSSMVESYCLLVFAMDNEEAIKTLVSLFGNNLPVAVLGKSIPDTWYLKDEAALKSFIEYYYKAIREHFANLQDFISFMMKWGDK